MNFTNIGSGAAIDVQCGMIEGLLGHVHIKSKDKIWTEELLQLLQKLAVIRSDAFGN